MRKPHVYNIIFLQVYLRRASGALNHYDIRILLIMLLKARHE